jgi:hypothetical protein
LPIPPVGSGGAFSARFSSRTDGARTYGADCSRTSLPGSNSEDMASFFLVLFVESFVGGMLTPISEETLKSARGGGNSGGGGGNA